MADAPTERRPRTPLPGKQGDRPPRQRLFPAVRAEDDATLIAATGVSCRQQIAHGTGRAARHPVQIVRDAL